MKEETMFFSIGCFVYLTLMLLAFGVYSVIVYYCWNLLIAPVFGITTLSLGQAALGALLLTLLSGGLSRK